MPILSKWNLGLLFIFIVAVIWSGSSVLLQYIFSDLDFRSPFLITYIENSLFCLYLPLFYFWRVFGFVDRIPYSNSELSKSSKQHLVKTNSQILTANNEENAQTNKNSTVNDDDDSDGSISSSNSSESDSSKYYNEFTHEKIFLVALLICPIWFFANCLYNYSLLMTSVSSSTIISNLAGPFTLIFSWLAKLEDSSWTKWLGIGIGMLGVCLVAYNDDENSLSENNIFGDLIALAAAAGYGLYTTVLKVKLPEDDATIMQLMLGYLGIINAIALLPLLLIFILVGYIDLSKMTYEVTGFLFLGGFLDNALSDYLWARSVVLTSPTVATVGLGLTIPLAMLSDFLTGKENPTVLEAVGAVFVLLGFCVVNLDVSQIAHASNFESAHDKDSSLNLQELDLSPVRSQNFSSSNSYRKLYENPEKL